MFRSSNNTPELFSVGKKVSHYSDLDFSGVITELDSNLIDLGYSATTCKVKWDDNVESIEWTNKLVLV